MDHSTASSTSVAGSNATLPGYDSAYLSQPDRDRSSRASSVARSEANSESGRYNKARKPINEAITSAFDEAHQQNALSPEILNRITTQITANVLQQLKASNLPAPSSQPVQPTQHTQPIAMPTDHVDSSSSFAGSPPLDRSKVYTPPSPHRDASVPVQISPTHSHFSTGSRRPPSPPSTTRGVSPHGTISQPEDSSDGKEDKTPRPRPPPQRLSTGDATILEKCWGKLFDDDRCTARLGQFLRGIALHLIENYEPKHSLVITPQKLQKYYHDTKIAREYYPWNDIFDDRTSSCSRLFRELQVEHHLIQDDLRERPDTPALTPKGFETWMTLVLRADPDLEFERLAYTALHMPINNPDDKSERFPKELSRRLFPKEGDKAVGHKLARALRIHCHVKLPSRGDSSSESDSKPKKLPTATAPSGGPPGHRPSYSDPSMSVPPTTSRSRRASHAGRTPGSSGPDVTSEWAIDDSQEPTVSSRPIERERKPYIAQPGGGRNYEGVDNVPLSKIQSQPPPQQHLHPPGSMDGRTGRSPSVTSTGRGQDPRSRNAPVAVHQSSTAGLEVPGSDQPPTRHRSGSFKARESRTDRNRSPSITRSRDYNHRSDPDVKGSSYYPNGNGGTSGYTQGYAWPEPRHDYPRPEQRAEQRPDQRSEHRLSLSQDPREGGREPRARFHSASASDGHRYHATDDDYYRQTVPGYVPDAGYAPYPPTSYRTK